MFSRYAITEDMPHTQREHIVNSISRSIREEESNLNSCSNDLDLIAHHHSQSLHEPQKVKKEEIVEYSEEEADQPPLKRRASEFSFDDISSVSQENSEVFGNLRENVKIHILGTYDLQSKKHDFKMDTTEVRLENVIIKAEGVSKEMFLKSLTCTSRKRVHL